MPPCDADENRTFSAALRRRRGASGRRSPSKGLCNTVVWLIAIFCTLQVNNSIPRPPSGAPNDATQPFA